MKNQNDREAAQWLLRAAEYGQPNAMHTMAELYRDGRGVNRDLVEAATWILLALDSYPPGGPHRPEAAQFEGALMNELSDEQAAGARRRASAWQKNGWEPAERQPPPFWSSGAAWTRHSGAT